METDSMGKQRLRLSSGECLAHPTTLLVGKPQQSGRQEGRYSAEKCGFRAIVCWDCTVAVIFQAASTVQIGREAQKRLVTGTIADKLCSRAIVRRPRTAGGAV